MTATSEIVPIMLDLDDCELGEEFEVASDVASSSLVARALSFAKSPIGIMSALGVVMAAGAFLAISNGALEIIGAPKLNNELKAKQEKIALSEEAMEPKEQEASISHLTSDAELGEASDVEDDYAYHRAKPDTAFQQAYGRITYSQDSAIYETAASSIDTGVEPGRAKHEITLSLGIVTDAASAQLLLEEGLAVSLMKVEVIQGLEFGPLRDWEIPGMITGALKLRIEDDFPNVVVRAVIIRDFQRS